MQGGARLAAGLLEKLGVSRAVVVGHSAGGLTALELHRRHVAVSKSCIIIEAVLQCPPVSLSAAPFRACVVAECVVHGIGLHAWCILLPRKTHLMCALARQCVHRCRGLLGVHACSRATHAQPDGVLPNLARMCLLTGRLRKWRGWSWSRRRCPRTRRKGMPGHGAAAAWAASSGWASRVPSCRRAPALLIGSLPWLRSAHVHVG